MTQQVRVQVRTANR